MQSVERVSLYRKGYATERRLVRKLIRAGFAAVRAPASGSKEAPDVIAARSGRILVFEVKLRKRRGYVVLEDTEVRALRTWAERAGAEAYVAVYVSEEKRWYVFPFSALERVGQRMCITTRMYERAMSLSDVISGWVACEDLMGAPS